MLPSIDQLINFALHRRLSLTTKSMSVPQAPPAADRLVLSPLLKEQTRDGGYVMVHEVTPMTVAIDVVSGLCAPLIVSSIIAVVDASIIMSVNGDKTPVVEGLRKNGKLLFATPHKFFAQQFWRRMCFLCWMVYGGTYAASNCAGSYIEANGISDANGKVMKVVAGASANIGLTLVKDVLMVSIISQLGGGAAAAGRKTSVPMLSRGCFLVRDALTMIAAFAVGDKVGSYLYANCSEWMGARTCRQIANLVVPVALQPVSTIFHLYGLNYSSNPGLSGAGMATAIREKYVASTGARMGRILPAVGVGNNINIALRDASFRFAEKRRFI
jgi:hypothetical protein